MANRIQLRRDTAANWTRVNPVLEDGEPGLEIDTNYVKYGDGNTAWADLAYASTGGGGSVSFDYSTVQEGTAGPANVTSITGGNNTGVSLTSEEWAQLMWVPNTANVTIADIGDGPATYNWAYVDQTGFRVESNVANVRNTWTFYANSLLTTPGNVQVGNVATYGNISFVNTIRANNYAYANGVSILAGITGGSANIGDITFDGIKIIGANIGNGSGDIKLVPDNTGDFYSSGQYVHIYPTRAVPDSPHIHIDSGYGGDLILGNDQRGIDINHNDNVYIRTDQYAGAYNWQFGADGNLALPNGTRIDASTDGYGIGLTTDRGTILFGNRPEIGQLNHFHIMKENTAAVDLFFGDDSDYVRLPGTGNVEIGAGGSAWTFGSNSNLSLPYGVGVIGAIETSDSVDLYGNSDAEYVQLNWNNQNFVYVDSTGAHMQAGPSAPGQYEIFLSTDGSTTFPDHMPVSITGNLTVGNLVVNGNSSIINTESYVVADNIIQMANANPADTLDLGFVAHRTVSGNLQHTGLVRDASSGLWKLFSNVAAQPGNTVDFTGAVYDDLQLDKLFADTIHLTGAAPGTVFGESGDLEGDIHVDSNYLYYCIQDWVASEWTVGWGGAVNNTLFLTQGDYPTPQVGWTVSQGGNDFTIDTISDTGYGSWQITWVGTPYGSPTGGTATLTNPNPASIWKSVPLSAFQTAANATTRLTNGGSEVALQANGVTTFGNTATISNNGEFRIWANNDITVYRNGQDGYAVKSGSIENYTDNTQRTVVNSNGIEIKTGNLIIPNDKGVVFANGVNILSTVSSSYGNTQVAAYLPTYSGNIGAANIVTTGATSGNISGANYISANVFQVSTGIFWANGTAWSSTSGSTYSNANVASYLTAGNISVGTAGFTVLPNIVAQFTSNVNSYGQVNMQNINSGTDATTEIVATANNGTDTIFFVDMGIAGNTYDNSSPNNSLGTIIYANDAYLYAQGNTSANVGGNLAIGTSTAGRVVTIFAGGINNTSNVATFANTGVTVHGNITVANIITTGTYGNITGANVISANTVTVTTFVRTQAVAFATLPTASAAGAGARAFITDGNTATFGSQVSGGGANAVPVYSNGTNWFVG